MKKLSFEEQTHLIDSFFNGKCFIEVNPNNSKDFLKFMSFYDSRWSDYEDLNITSTRYYAWRFPMRFTTTSLSLTQAETIGKEGF